MKFEWDINKAALNIKKHGVSFEEAIETFYDPNAVRGFDSEHSEYEKRFYLIGFSSRRLLFVIYAEKVDSETIRIISARKAEAKYRDEYTEENYEKQ
ncbi:MAG TPA: BrnT family toxin [Pyrinomonadaceae bacterium]|nr:BrnT family toxin [Pyrinomonadaceae bacterium]